MQRFTAMVGEGAKYFLHIGAHDPSGLWIDRAIKESKLQLKLMRVALVDRLVSTEQTDGLPSIPIKEANAPQGGGDSRSARN